MTAPLINGYEVVIGFETHAQLATASKIFSRTSTAFGAEPTRRRGISYAGFCLKKTSCEHDGFLYLQELAMGI